MLELDAEDLDQLEEELSQWQHNSFTTANNHQMVQSMQDSFSAGHPPAFQTPSPAQNIFIGDIDDDPLGLYHPKSTQNLVTPFENSFGAPIPINSSLYATSFNHQLELEQMEALAQLSLNDDPNGPSAANENQRSFSRPTNKNLQNNDLFPSIDPPAPISSPSFHPAVTHADEQRSFSSPIFNDIAGRDHSFTSPVINHVDSSFGNVNQERLEQKDLEWEGEKEELLKRIAKLEQEKIMMKNDFNTERDNLIGQISRTDSSISTIKSALMKEHQMNLLQFKKELLEQKERQLESIREEMRLERENMELRMQDQMLMSEKQWQHEKELLLKDLEYSKMNQSVSVERVSEFVQTDLFESTPEQQYHKSVQVDQLRNMNAQLMEKESDLQLTLASMENELSQKTNEIVALKDEVDSLTEKNKKLAAKMKRMQTVPNPLQFASADKENDSNLANNELLVQQIEERYAKAYDTAIQHLKTSYSNLTNKLNQKTEQAQEDAVLRVRQELEHILEDKESELLSEKSQVMILTSQVKDFEIQHQKQREQHYKMMEQMKSQYLATLKQMRDDVALSKSRSIERVRDAWIKKKESLDKTWKLKFEELKSEYEDKLTKASTPYRSTRN